MINLTFPDGARREFPAGTTGREIVEGIAKSLARKTVAMALDGTVVDLSDPITRDARIEFLNREDPRALDLIRHDCAHVLAEAVQELYPGTQVTIGPVIGETASITISPATSRSRPRISLRSRRRCARSSRANQPFTKGEKEGGGVNGRVTRPRRVFEKRRARPTRSSSSMRSPPDQSLKIYRQGDLVRPMPRPAHDLDGQDRQRLQADEGGRAPIGAGRFPATPC